jgi:hypothetical protein
MRKSRWNFGLNGIENLVELDSCIHVRMIKMNDFLKQLMNHSECRHKVFKRNSYKHVEC